MPGHNLGLFDWIEILALQVLLGAYRQHLCVAYLTHDHWERTRFASLCAGTAPRNAATVAIDELKAPTPSLLGIAMWADDQHALETDFAHGLSQFPNAVVIEGLPSLVRTILHRCVRHMLHLLTGLRLVIDHLVNRRLNPRLAAPCDPLSAFATHD
jgi:hypothetical protein